ncbi:MAG: resolvase [Flavobacteriales bacterium]|nr:resolvase [Flavobacteriales bacterium]|tara:strand:- start:552 stop:1202 length:651 start_codon:yes stop_codon:yes gene_type:complete
MKFGYARVSTESQNLDMQIDLLLAHGVAPENIFSEKESGAKNDREELDALLMRLREGDIILFYDLSRVGRNLIHLLTLVEWFRDRKIDFKDLTNPSINTQNVDTPSGYMIFAISALFADVQRKNIRHNVIKGLEAAKRRGKVGGRPRGLSKRLIKKAPLVAAMYKSKDPEYSISDIRQVNEISQASVYKCLIHEGIDINANHRNKGNNNRTKNTKI